MVYRKPKNIMDNRLKKELEIISKKYPIGIYDNPNRKYSIKIVKHLIESNGLGDEIVTWQFFTNNPNNKSHWGHTGKSRDGFMEGYKLRK